MKISRDLLGIAPDGVLNSPHCIVIAGPNGAGKTTFAREFLPHDAKVTHYVNVDLLAAGLSPLQPELAKVQAGKLFLSELDRLATIGSNFAFESTLSGLSYVSKIKSWKASGYQITIVFLRLGSVGMALNRIRARVIQGGHDVSPSDVKRRFERGWNNFQSAYRPLADFWAIYDNSGAQPELLEKSE